MDEEPALIDSLRRHWRALAVFALLVATAAIVVERKLFPAPEAEDEAPVTPAQPVPPARADAKGGDSVADKPSGTADAQQGAAKENPATAVMSQTVAVDARPAAVLKGQGKWDDAAKTISSALEKLTAAATKAGLTVNGRPIAVFTKTDDTGFSFEAMAPLTAAPEGKIKLAEGVEIGASPAGNALKFQHRGAYDEIDATYEAIAAYLDEKGLDTKDLIIEEYLTDFKSEDANVDVDIYVFLK